MGRSGDENLPYYDSLLGKLTIWGRDRAHALERARAVLDDFLVEGMPTTLGFHRWLVRQPEFLRGALDVKWIDRQYRGEVLPASGVGPLVLPTPPEFPVELHSTGSQAPR